MEDERWSIGTSADDKVGASSTKQQMPTTVTQSQFDDWGNLVRSTVIIDYQNGSGQHITTSENWYDGSYTDSDDASVSEPSVCTSAVNNTYGQMQRYGRLSCTKVTKTLSLNGVEAGSQTGTDTKYGAFGYNSDGVLDTQVTALGTNRQVKTAYTFDAWGNTTQTTLTAPAFTKTTNGQASSTGGTITRSTRATFDASGRYLVSTTNAKGHLSCMTYGDLDRLAATYSNVTSCTSLSGGQRTRYQYNVLGERIAVENADGLVTQTHSHWCSTDTKATCAIGTDVANYSYYKVDHIDGRPEATTYYDVLGREIVTQAPDMNNEAVYQVKAYTADNKVKATYAPTKNINAAVNHAANVEYDLFDRVIKTVTPTTKGRLKTTKSSYQGFTATHTQTGTDHTGQTVTTTFKETKDFLGQVTHLTDNANHTLRKHYNLHGQLIQTTDAAGNITRMTYNAEGERTSLSDPDKGYWAYEYNGLGELVEQTDAKGQVIRSTYDVLGRVTHSISNATRPAQAVSTCTIYDQQFQGSVDQITKRKGLSCSSGEIIEQVNTAYDEVLRPTQSTRTVTGPSGELHTFISKRYYDELGREVITQIDNQLATLSAYKNGYAYKSLLLTATSAGITRDTLREVTALDSWGKATGVKLLNNIQQTINYDATSGLQLGVESGTSTAYGELSYTFDVDSFGNMTYRTVNNMEDAQHTETFDYDNLFRLTGYHINNQQYSHYCYDTLGNLTVKGIGEATQGCTSHADYQYGTVTFDETTGRHTRGTGNAGVHAVRQITNSTHNLTLQYDNNGNMYSDGERTITYNADDQATRIHKAGVQQIDFGYGIGGRIWHQDTKKGDVPHDPKDATKGLADNENRITYDLSPKLKPILR